MTDACTAYPAPFKASINPHLQHGGLLMPPSFDATSNETGMPLDFKVATASWVGKSLGFKLQVHQPKFPILGQVTDRRV